MQPAPSPPEALQLDTTASAGTAVYDSVWAGGIPEAPPVGLETVMLQQDKLYVVLAVVLIIWFGMLFFLYRTDLRLKRLENELDAEATALEREGEVTA
jgi:CcmD family protein